MKSRVGRPTLNHVKLLSPEIKLVPLSDSSLSQLEGESSFLKKELVVKLDDVGKCLKKRRNGGFTLVPGRNVASGRKALSNYCEKTLSKSTSKHIFPSATEEQSQTKNPRSVCDAEYKRGRKKKIKVRKNLSDRREKYFVARYGNLQFKELNTISRMSSRYKVAFTKWPRVFSGALDLINQRLANQNAFWDTIRSWEAICLNMKIQGVAFILNQSVSFTRDPVSYSKIIAAMIKFLIFLKLQFGVSMFAPSL